MQNGQGTGLGLYISKGIMDMHKGHLFVTSEGEGHGATFTLLLPIVKKSQTTTNVEMVSSASSCKSLLVGVESQSNVKAGIIDNIIIDDDETKSNDTSTADNDNFKINQIYSYSSNEIVSTTTLELIDNHVVTAQEENNECKLEILNKSNNVNSNEHCCSDISGNNSNHNVNNYAINNMDTTTATITTDNNNIDIGYKPDQVLLNQETLLSPVDQVRVIHVLIVDDSSACRMMTERSMNVIERTDCHIQCHQASHGQQAVDMIKVALNTENNSRANLTIPADISSLPKSHQDNVISSNCSSTSTKPIVYDLILMDYQMPHMDGPTAIRRIRELGYQGKIVGLTGNILGSEIETMQSSGANRVLSKPVKHAQLESLMLEL